MPEEPRITMDDLRRASREAFNRLRAKSEFKPDEFDLLNLYVNKGLDLRDIGAEFKVSKDTVRVWLIAAEIPLRPRGVRGGGYSGITKRLFEAEARLQARHVTLKVTEAFLSAVVQARIAALKNWAADVVEDAVLARKVLDEANLLERLLADFIEAKREFDAIRAMFGDK